MNEAIDPVDGLWAFSLRLYANPAVAAQMLDWQDRRGANVNLALLCLWAAECGRALDPRDCERAERAAGGWHAATIAPLRGLRRRLKSDWVGLAQNAEPTRQAVLAAELEAERAEQALLQAALAPWPAAAARQPRIRSLARANLLAYLGAAATAEIDALLAAIG